MDWPKCQKLVVERCTTQKRSGDAEAKRAHHEVAADTWKRVAGSAIHCVGGGRTGDHERDFTYPMNWWLVSMGWKHGMT